MLILYWSIWLQLDIRGDAMRTVCILCSIRRKYERAATHPIFDIVVPAVSLHFFGNVCKINVFLFALLDLIAHPCFF